MTARSPNTFVVGAGPAATALAGALRLAGVPVLGLWARRPAAARAAGAIAGVAAFSAAPPDLLLEADVILVGVTDAAIGDVAKMLVGTGLVTAKHVLLHCSGALSASDAFGPAASKVGGVGTMHPLRAIADPRTAMRAMKGTIFGVEGDERGKAHAQALVHAMGGTALELDGKHMASYHAAAAIASNYAVALLDAAAAVLSGIGVPPEQALAALVPLAQGAIANVAQREKEGIAAIAAALTGPIRRGDAQTIERHLSALANDPEVAEIYRVLGRRTAAIAARLEGDGAPAPADLETIERLLAPTSGAAAAPASNPTPTNGKTIRS
ncbi:MAG TPA: DUF2520 domain-containing protein [Kofleriaceae bacterium]|nr:DUF2520 domain-containing protein [Kofleriaceae bacterium]